MTRTSLIAFTLLLAAGCGGDADESAQPDDSAVGQAAAVEPAGAAAAGDGPASCLVGTWTQASPSFSPQFVFNADGTGEETTAESQGGEVRGFRWEPKGDSEVTITFPATDGGTEASTDWAVNCEGGTFAGLYRKQ